MGHRAVLGCAGLENAATPTSCAAGASGTAACVPKFIVTCMCICILMTLLHSAEIVS